MKKHPALILVSLLFLVLVGILGLIKDPLILRANTNFSSPSLPPGPFVVRVYYDTIPDVERLQEYDLWEYNNLAEKYVLVSVDATLYRELLTKGWRLQVDEEGTAQLAQTMRAGSMFDQGYRTVDELYADLLVSNENYPTLTELVVYGDSHCKSSGGCITLGGDDQPGYDLLAIRVSNEAIPGTSDVSSTTITRGTKPVFFLMANIHAREITTPEIAMRFLDWLVDGYGRDADITWLVDWHEIWIVPTANPDGHWLVSLGTDEKYGGAPFSQRKNANRDANNDSIIDCGQWPPFPFAQYGVDLNRNHSFMWGPPGSSNEPCNLTYRGPAKASEPEVARLEELVRALIPDQRGPAINDAAPKDATGLLITMHSYSNLVLWPWGFSYQKAPNRDDLKAIGDRFAKFNGYQSCQPTECLYGANGTTDDWAYGELGIPAFTFEIGDRFMPPYREIDSIQWPENKPALFYAAQISRSPYITVHGPQVSQINISGWGTTVNVSALVDDRANGNRSIAAAAYSLNLPFWADQIEETSLTATDGDFNSSVEEISGIIDVSGLAPGRQTIFIRGQDEDGHWGPVSAAYFDLKPEAEINLYLPAIVQP